MQKFLTLFQQYCVIIHCDVIAVVYEIFIPWVICNGYEGKHGVNKNQEWDRKAVLNILNTLSVNVVLQYMYTDIHHHDYIHNSCPLALSQFALPDTFSKMILVYRNILFCFIFDKE